MTLNNKKKTLIVFALAGALIIGGVAMKKDASAAEKVRMNMDKIDQAIQYEIQEHTDLSFSSNPYSYVADNEYYNNLVKLGVAALPELENLLKTSEGNGLNEYIVAIAVEEISHADVNAIVGNPDDSGWENAKEFSGEWASIKAEADNTVKEIIGLTNLGAKEKAEKISNYGVLAVPAMEQYIDNQKTKRSSDGLANELTKVMNSYDLSSKDVTIISDYIDAK